MINSSCLFFFLHQEIWQIYIFTPPTNILSQSCFLFSTQYWLNIKSNISQIVHRYDMSTVCVGVNHYLMSTLQYSWQCVPFCLGNEGLPMCNLPYLNQGQRRSSLLHSCRLSMRSGSATIRQPWNKGFHIVCEETDVEYWAPCCLVQRRSG